MIAIKKNHTACLPYGLSFSARELPPGDFTSQHLRNYNYGTHFGCRLTGCSTRLGVSVDILRK